MRTTNHLNILGNQCLRFLSKKIRSTGIVDPAINSYGENKELKTAFNFDFDVVESRNVTNFFKKEMIEPLQGVSDTINSHDGTLYCVRMMPLAGVQCEILEQDNIVIRLTRAYDMNTKTYIASLEIVTVVLWKM